MKNPDKYLKMLRDLIRGHSTDGKPTLSDEELEFVEKLGKGRRKRWSDEDRAALEDLWYDFTYIRFKGRH